MDEGVLAKLEAVVAGGEFVFMPRAEAEALRARAGAGEAVGDETFSADDLKVLAELIRVWRGITALGVLAKFAKSTLYMLAGGAAVVFWLKGKLSFEAAWKAVFG